MRNQYKIIISNRNIYKEAVLNPQAEEIKAGTQTGDDIRLQKDAFFEPVELVFLNKGSSWTLLTADNLYLTEGSGDIRKLRSRDLAHGDVVEIHYQESDNFVFRLEFSIDFDEGSHKFNRYADLKGIDRVAIGAGTDNNIVLNSVYTGNDQIELSRNAGGFRLHIAHASYGVLHNGKKAKDGEQINDRDFFSVSDCYFYLRNNQLWTEKSDAIRFAGLKIYDAVDRGDYPKFHRSSRVKSAVNEETIPFLDPAQKPQKPKNDLFVRLLASMGMVMAGVLMAVIGSPTMLIFSGVSVVFAVINAVVSLRQNNKEYKESLAERNSTYQTYVANKREEIERCREEERKTLEEIYIPVEQESRNIHHFSPELFDRTKEDEDFLCLRLGFGDVETHQEIDYKKREKLEPGDELQQIPEKIKKEYEYVHNAPVVCDLKKINAAGIVGEGESRFDLLKNLVVDLCARQYHSDVSLFFVAKREHQDRVRWLRYLPHVWNDDLGVRNLVMDDESKTVLFEYLYQELTKREQDKSYENHIVLFFYDEYGFQNHPISRFVSKAKELGITFVFFGEHKADIPGGCESLIFLNDSGSGYLVNAGDRKDKHDFRFSPLSLPQAERIVEILAPVYVDEISLEGNLTKNISLFEMLNIITVEDIDLAERWKRSNVTKSMAAPLGVTKTGLIELDLHDKAHGPHGLVAGTTGSGKSEILQTYILAMATMFSPLEVGFMIIDFKGGGMVNQFEHLPHLLGAITNIDGKEIDRSLKSIKAELQKRQRLFAEADVNHIDKYIEKYRTGMARIPLPHLIIIVDEFAELKAEQPEFMKELISAARIGRSLGVHLILATQKPAGQVNEQIWSNSRFKLCLKVQSKEDSNEVLKSPLAAEIKEPGRAYLQVGNNEIFELLQSAYSGAPEKAETGERKPFTVFELTDSGKRLPVFVQKNQKAEGNVTQLDAVVRYVDAFCKKNRIPQLSGIILPSLKEQIAFPECDALLAKDIHVTTEIGIYDDPDNQYQGVYAVDLANRNTMIIGSAQSGKTNILQTMIRSLATKYSPEEVNIYIIDFASMVLKNFEDLHHVGGVVTSSEDEKLKNLFKLLFREIETRKEKMLAVGVSSFTAYKEAGKTDLPQIVLMIDNLTALRELYFQDDDELLKLCREGLSVGISLVIANSQTTGIGYRYLSNFACRIAMFCNDTKEYGALFEHCRTQPADVHGRMLVEIDKNHLDCQGFLAFEGEKEIDRVNTIRTFIEERNQSFANMAAKQIPVIPDVFEKKLADEMTKELHLSGTEILSGLDYSSVSPVVWDLETLGVLTLTGREGMGQHNFLRYLISEQLKRNAKHVEIHIIDDLKKRLQAASTLPQVKTYEYLSMKATELIRNAAAVLQERYEKLSLGDEQALSDAPLLLLILNNPECLKDISNDKEAMAAYRDITGRLRSMKVCIIISSYENTQVSYSAPEVIKKVKDDGHFLVFEDLSNFKVVDLPMGLLRVYKKQVEPGDCYYIKGNQCRKLKTPLVG